MTTAGTFLALGERDWALFRDLGILSRAKTSPYQHKPAQIKGERRQPVRGLEIGLGHSGGLGRLERALSALTRSWAAISVPLMDRRVLWALLVRDTSDLVRCSGCSTQSGLRLGQFGRGSLRFCPEGVALCLSACF
jgi:hypothetical protein